MLMGRWLLPNRAPLAGLATRRDDVVYISELIVDAQSSVAGKRVADVFAVLPNAAACDGSRPGRAPPPPPIQPHPSSSEAERPRAAELLELVRDGDIYQVGEAQDDGAGSRATSCWCRAHPRKSTRCSSPAACSWPPY